MWFLKRLDGTLYPLYTKSEHIIGRFGSLELADDASISRQHASIVITLKNGRAKFAFQDLGSKYGTFLNDGIDSVTPIPKKKLIELKIGDRIKFGLQSNTWILKETRFVTSTSWLTSHEKTTTLKDFLTKLKGDIVTDWNANCTHLTMPQIKTTIKVLCAAAQVKPIVSLDYWKHLAAVFFGSVETPLPDCDEFVPPIAEPQIKSSLISLKMNKNRQTMFKGFKFVVFDDAQMKNIVPVVEAAGGTVVDGSSRNFKINESELCKEKVIVVQANEQSARNTRIANILNSKKLRLISDTEIYLSIFESSTERHCNPKYDVGVLLFPSDSEISVKEEPSVLADATQDPRSIQETQFLETASANFALEVDDRVGSSDSDDDIIPGTDPSIISGTPDSSAPKRKLPMTESVVKRKSARLDSWLLRKESNSSGESVASESLFPASSRTNTKGFKDLFSSRTSGKETKASTSLFSPNNDSSPQPASLKDKEIVSRTGSLFAAATNKPSEAGDRKVSRTAGLFANVTRATRSSSDLSSGSQEPSTSKNMVSGKRKRENEGDGDCKPGSRTADLFEKRVKRRSAVVEIPDSDSNDDSDAIPKKTSKLTADDAPIYQDSPVDIPSKMSLSQFQSAPAKENVTVKTEDVSPIKDALDRSVVHTMPLVLSDNKPNVQRQSTNTSVRNFKRFRKNQVCYPASSLPNIMKLTLFSGGMENGFHND